VIIKIQILGRKVSSGIDNTMNFTQLRRKIIEEVEKELQSLEGTHTFFIGRIEVTRDL
jgi:acyl-CoA hydrolase